jgi:hypothetical protein
MVKNETVKKKINDPNIQFEVLTSSMSLSMVRLLDAEIVSYKSSLALLAINGEKEVFKELFEPYSDLSKLLEIKFQQYDHFSYISNLSFLVYLTTIFDTYLSDVTKFLFSLFPNSLQNSQSVDIKTILTSKSKFDILNSTIEKKVLEISYSSFFDRISMLEKKFGLNFSIPQNIIDYLHHYSSLRNTAIHNQSFFEIFLNSKGKTELRQITCPHHPTLVTHEDIKNASEIYRFLMKEIYFSVKKQILKSDLRDNNYLSKLR